MLKVDVVLLIELVFRRLGQEVFNVEKLRKTVESDPAVWDIYAKGLTIGVNQCEKPATIEKVKRYKPKNVSELAAFIAAIRPGFKSMYGKFESREPFSYDIPALDKLIQTEQIKDSYILFQENLMTILHYASFLMSETYTAVKNIAKKKVDKVKQLKDKFEEGCTEQIIKDEHISKEDAKMISERIWRIINDSSSYLFNACLAGDTVIFRNNTGCGRLTIEEMYNIRNDIQYAKDTGHTDLWKKYEMYGYGNGYSMQPDEENVVKKNPIVDIRTAGVRDTYRVTLEGGAYVVATMNHKFPTEHGEKHLADLTVGDKLFVKDAYKKSNFDTSFTDGDYVKNIPHKGQMHGQKGYTTHLEKIVSIEFEKTQMTYDVEMAAPYHNFALDNGMIVSNSHAYCMALDSLYCAYLKAHYPYEFYEVLLQFYSDKGNKEKVRLIKQEMRAFGISEGQYRFGVDNRRFRADPDNRQIIPSLLSIKSLSQKCADIMYELGQRQWSSFMELYQEAKKRGVNSRQMDILIKIDYFSSFGNQRQLGEIIEMIELFGWKERRSIDINKVPESYRKYVYPFIDEKGNYIYDEALGLDVVKRERDAALDNLVNGMKQKYKTKKASLEMIRSKADVPEVKHYYAVKKGFEQILEERQTRIVEAQIVRGHKCLLRICEDILHTVPDYSKIEKIQREFECLGYLATDYSKTKPIYGIVSKIDDKYATRKVEIYRICDGESTLYKVYSKAWETLPLEEGDIIRLLDAKQDYKRMKNEAGQWVPTKEQEWILKKYDRFSLKLETAS